MVLGRYFETHDIEMISHLFHLRYNKIEYYKTIILAM